MQRSSDHASEENEDEACFHREFRSTRRIGYAGGSADSENPTNEVRLRRLMVMQYKIGKTEK
jgi:hypothetical protein